MITLRRLDLVRQESPATADELASLQTQVNAQLTATPAAVGDTSGLQDQIDAQQAEIDALMAQVTALTPVYGAWTPILGGAGGTSGQTYNANSTGRYTKIGTRIFLECHPWLTVKGTITGNVEIQGLPFPMRTTPAGLAASVTVGLWVTTTAFVQVTGFINSTRPSSIQLFGVPAAALNSASVPIVTAHLADTATLLVSASYEA